MKEYIECEATCKDCFHYDICSLWSTTDLDEDEAYKYCFGKFKSTADVAEVRHGEWEETDWVEYDGHGECIRYPKQGLRCPLCCHVFKKELLYKDNYCPNCGADMRGKGEDNERGI